MIKLFTTKDLFDLHLYLNTHSNEQNKIKAADKLNFF